MEKADERAEISDNPIVEKYNSKVLPWFEKNAELGSFQSQTPRADGSTPTIRYCVIPGNDVGFTKAVCFSLGWSESYMKYKEVRTQGYLRV